MNKKTSFWSAIFSLVTIPVIIGLVCVFLGLKEAFEESPTVSAILVTLGLFLGAWKVLIQQEDIDDLKRKKY